jgi:hypothetical protein
MLFDAQSFLLEGNDSPISSERRTIAETITAKAAIELESLLRIYYLRHGFEAFDALLLTHLVHLSNIVLKRLARIADQGLPTDNIETLRSTLFLCLKGLYDQSKNFRMAGIVLGVMKNQLSPEDQNVAGQFITTKDPDLDWEAIERAQPIISEYVVPSIHLGEDPKLGKLVNKF